MGFLLHSLEITKLFHCLILVLTGHFWDQKYAVGTLVYVYQLANGKIVLLTTLGEDLLYIIPWEFSPFEFGGSYFQVLRIVL